MVSIIPAQINFVSCAECIGSVLNRTAPWLSSQAPSHLCLVLSLVGTALVAPTLLVPLLSPEHQSSRCRARQAARVHVHSCRIKYKVKLHKSVMYPYAGFGWNKQTLHIASVVCFCRVLTDSPWHQYKLKWKQICTHNSFLLHNKLTIFSP
jgi:hypothetical protein